MQNFPICMYCRYFNISEKTFNKCKAFFEAPGIPWEIISGENDHRKPLKIQKNKIVFKRR